MSDDKDIYDIYARGGFWSRTMAFIKCHVIGVLFVMEAILVAEGVICMVVAHLSEVGPGVFWLLTAICFFLIQIWVVLGSIRLLLFYSQSLRRLKTGSSREERCQPAAPADTHTESTEQ